MRTIPLHRLIALATDRPAGMILECLTRGRLRSDNLLEFDARCYAELDCRYRLSDAPDPTSLPCCD